MNPNPARKRDQPELHGTPVVLSEVLLDLTLLQYLELHTSRAGKAGRVPGV